MDGSRFDSLARMLAASGSRRRLVGGLVAGALGLVERRGADATACRAVGASCREHSNCCSGLCGPRDATGRRRCGCQIDADCGAFQACGGGGVPGQCGCIPNCAGTCGGTDGCGGTCPGQCAEGRTCLSNGTCAVPCPNGGNDCTVLGCGQCFSTSDGNVCGIAGDTGPCDHSNDDCPIGSGCSGVACFAVC